MKGQRKRQGIRERDKGIGIRSRSRASEGTGIGKRPISDPVT